MRHGVFTVLTCWTVVSLSACGESPQAPTAGEDPVELKRNASPTVAVNMGPFEEGSGCSGGSFPFYAGSAAFDVNVEGVAVGSTSCVAAEGLTFRWSEGGGMEQLANFARGYPIIGAESINESGTIAGTLLGWGELPFSNSRPVLWTLANTRIDIVPRVLCEEGADPAPAECSIVPVGHYINDNNVVVGVYVGGAYRWTAETGLVYLPSLGDRWPTALNKHGDLAATGPLGGAALLRKSGVLTEITDIWPLSINDKRDMVGYAGTWPNVTAVLWSQGRGLRTLGTLGGGRSIAYDINQRGEVVGSSTNGSGESRAFYWTAARGMIDLGPGIAYAISDAGHIVGTAPWVPFQEQFIWQATLWRGTGGVEPSALVPRRGTTQGGRTEACFAKEPNWRSKSRMLTCLAGVARSTQ
jgi:probable HAF family extracellular repeat protein